MHLIECTPCEQVAARYLQTPTFIWQSRYDTDQRSCEMSTSCAESRECIERYGHALANTIRSELLQGSLPHRKLPIAAAHAANHSSGPAHGPAHGAFIDACDRHCEDGVPMPLRIATVEGASPLQALAIWHRSDGRSPMEWQQIASYPCTDCCTGPGSE